MKTSVFKNPGAYKGNKEFVDLLISKGVNLNQQDTNGDTAIMIGNLLFHINSMIMSFLFQAINNNQQIIAEKLLNAGANQNIRNREGGTALYLGKILFFWLYDYESKQEHWFILYL